ncbi:MULTISPECIES: nuclear transport factor 2 family protein [unclassified Blastococcus]
METWELVARERVRDTLARYNWAGDAGRAEELAAAFTPDGVLQLRGGATATGRAEIRELIGGVAGAPPVDPGVRRLVRHLLTNTRFTAVSPEEVTTASYFTVVTERGLDHTGRYRDTFVPVGDEWLIAHRLVSTDWIRPDTAMGGGRRD